MRRLFSTIKIYFLGFLACACSLEELQLPDPENKKEINLTFNIKTADKTKSSITDNEENIKTIDLFLYTGGKLTNHIKSDGSGAFKARIMSDKTYNIYALANKKGIPEIEDESELKNLQLRFSGLQEYSESLPMYWQYEGYNANGTSGDQSISIVFRQLVNKLEFSMDKKGYSEMKITSVRLCQSASAIYPFREESRAETAQDIINGDYASILDLDALNSGQSITLYTLENMQGVLLEGNQDPWEKNPANLNEKKDLCTYLEVCGNFDKTSIVQGDVTYRFYLGQDNCTDFNVRRNEHTKVKLIVGNDIAGKFTWKLNTNITMENGYAWGSLKQGLHAVNDMYIGEYCLLSIQADERLLKYFGGSLDKCQLKYIPKDKGDMTFTEITEEAPCKYVCKGNCTKAGTGSIWLVSPDGANLINLFSDVLIQKPIMVISNKKPNLYIAGEAKTAKLYLRDKNGNNLLSSDLGFNGSLFNIVYTNARYMTDAYKQVKTDFSKDQRADCWNITMQCFNEKKSWQAISDLCMAVIMQCGGKLQFVETNHGIETEVNYKLSVLPITLTLRDDRWNNKFGNVRLDLKIENPSKLPLRVTFWEIISTTNVCEVEEVPPLDIQCERIQYINSNLAPDRDYPYYGTEYTFLDDNNKKSEVNSISEKGGKWYPMKGINSDNLVRATLGDLARGQYLYHLIDISLNCGGNVLNVKGGDYGLTVPSGLGRLTEINVKNELSDGSVKFNEIYRKGDVSEEEWFNNQGLFTDGGIKVFSCNAKIYPNNCDALDKENISPLNLSWLSNPDNTCSVSFHWDKNRETAGMTWNNLKEEFFANIDISGTCKGTAITHPRGTKNKAVKKYCSADIQYSNSASAKDGVQDINFPFIQKSIDKIYSYTFHDSWNLWGDHNSYEHHAHAEEISATIKIRGSYWMQPIRDIGSFRVPYYHEQDKKDYEMPCCFFIRPKIFKTVKKIVN